VNACALKSWAISGSSVVAATHQTGEVNVLALVIVVAAMSAVWLGLRRLRRAIHVRRRRLGNSVDSLGRKVHRWLIVGVAAAVVLALIVGWLTH
jgi:hypothetical protein